MPLSAITSAIPPGFMLIQGNRTESLRQLAVTWLRRHPLAPLEQEVFLVQSNGIAQWLKQALARNRAGQDGGCGIAAALDMQLPARLQWQAYRAVLGDLPDASPFDKPALLWRLMRLLPTLADTVYAPLQRFLQDDTDGRQCYQLAGKLADLFDQYQVYRADWLRDWENGRENAVPPEQRWQPALWRALVADMPPGQHDTSRSAVHERFLAAAKNLTAASRIKTWPRRVVVFGISSMPKQTLDVLAAMARCTQVVFFVNNPCEKYWGDIVEGRELFTHAYRRQDASAFAGKSDAVIHAEAQPLLAAWGKQGRDYMRLLDEHDERQAYEQWCADNTIALDLFEAPPADTLLGQLQGDILQLVSPGDRQAQNTTLAGNDHSIVFHIAHSPQREVEILHDQLLAAFAQDKQLQPRDIMVMVPDINTYAPHIQAVFGQLSRDDHRYIPFTLADQQQRQQKPLLIALEHLLRLDQSRFAASEILDLLDVPALRERFGLADSDLPVLRRWVRGAGIRWGLDAAQRAALGMPADMAQNSWLAGLRRLLLGYAVGAGDAWQDVEPYDEIGGLEAARVGPLCDLLAALEQYWNTLREPATPAVWGERLRQLLADFFAVRSSDDDALLARLEQQLDSWLQLCEQAGFADSLSLAVVREHWLAAVDQPQLSQRFLAGAVNFATLMPMRAIPFRRICLLGMNHTDFPRRQPAADFDLMAQRGQYRPGDRSRREDDRYLFLEALLSAREQFYVSWVGRSVKDNAGLPPSVLVAQLRDHLDACWSGAAQQLTVEHPLQPFSRDYFAGQPQLFTYAQEWRAVHDRPADIALAAGAVAIATTQEISLNDLADFLRNPAQAYFKRVLKTDMDIAVDELDDKEPFSVGGLASWQLRNDLLEPVAAALRKGQRVDIEALLDDEAAGLQRAGTLQHAVFGELAAKTLVAETAGILQRYREQLAALVPQEAIAVQGEHAGIRWSGHVDALYTADDKTVRLLLTPSNLVSGKEIRCHHLVKHWPAHLALCAQGVTLATVIVHAGDVVVMPALAAKTAQHYLQDLLASFALGMQAPLPAPCKTAFAWLKENPVPSAEPASEKAEAAYDGGFNVTGEVAESAALARCWPDFHALQQSGHFASWAEKLYRPLYAWMRVQQGEPA